MSELPENLPSSILSEAWFELYKCLGERMQDGELELMDSVLAGVVNEYQERLLCSEQEGNTDTMC